MSAPNPKPSGLVTEEGRSWTKEEGTMDKTGTGAVGVEGFESAAKAARGCEWDCEARDALITVEEQRNRWIRLFNRLDAAVSRHRSAPFRADHADEADDALAAAHDRILKSAAKPGADATDPSSETGAKPSYSELETELGAVEAELGRLRETVREIDVLASWGPFRDQDKQARYLRSICELAEKALDASSPGREGRDGGTDEGPDDV